MIHRTHHIKALLIVLLTAFLFLSGYAQENQRATVSYTPEENGYELSIPFVWKFINCYGEVHVTITKKQKDVTSNAYIYKGVRYTAAELGNEAFAKPSCGLTDLSADVYDQSFRLGNVEMGNVIDWLGGCFGQTYHVTELLGLADAEYKDKVEQLSLSNLKLLKIDSRNYDLEGKIKEIEKENSLRDKLEEADRDFDSGNFEDAKARYEEALKIDFTNTPAKERLNEIKDKLKQEQNEEAFQNLIYQAEDLEEKGDLEGAIATYKKALKKKADDEHAKDKIEELEQILEEEKQERVDQEEAVSEASNRKHSGFFWGTNYDAASAGSDTQAANLIGNFRVDYDIWSLTGEPAYKFRFYWEWSNSLNTGYPQWVSVLHDEVVMIEELEKYPDLMTRWNQIKPLYIELECDILYYKNGDEYVADEGTIHIVPEIIGKSGEEVSWSQPSSSNWDELFTYCNGIDWSYFRKLGLYEEINEYEDKFGTDVAWAKHAFEFSNEINFFQDYSWFHSEFKELTAADYDQFSSSADIVKIVWPVEEIKSVIEEFETREKQKKEEVMDLEDFWNTPESDKKEAPDDFWNTPDNSTTKSEAVAQQLEYEEQQLIAGWTDIVDRRREKYQALLHPFIIDTPANNSTHDKNVVTVEGSINQYFQRYSNEVFLNLNGVEQQVNIGSNGSFSNAMVLSNGRNDIKLVLEGNGFTLEQPLTVYYNGRDTDIRVTLTWNTSSSDLDLYLIDPDSRTCNYSTRNSGAMSLDVDDTDGFGPENISVVDGYPGRYEIKVQNFARGQGAEATVYIYLNEELDEILTHTFYDSKETWEVKSIYLE